MTAFYIIVSVLIVMVWMFSALVAIPLVVKAKKFIKQYVEYIENKENEE